MTGKNIEKRMKKEKEKENNDKDNEGNSIFNNESSCVNKIDMTKYNIISIDNIGKAGKTI